MTRTRRKARGVVLSVIVTMLCLAGCQGTSSEVPTSTPASLPPRLVSEPTRSATVTPQPLVQRPTVPLLEPATPQAIVVDNNDPGFAIDAGEWGHCFDGECGGTCFGQDFVYAEPGCLTCQASFALTVPRSGDYDLWAWWPWGEDRATNTAFTLVYSGGSLPIEVDQQNSGNLWFWLAKVGLSEGDRIRVIVQGSRTGYANADAIALTPAGTEPPAEDTEIAIPLVGDVELAATPTPDTQPRVPTPLPSQDYRPAGGGKAIIFLHHSCGANLIEQGGVRQRFTERGYEFFDHGYNGDGLVLADGTWTGDHWDVPDDNTDPGGLAVIFAQPLHRPPDNTLSHLLEFDTIIFKSCFPNSNVGSDEQLAEFKGFYLSMRDRMDQFPDKLFVIVTQPPQVPSNTNAAEARRARALANWLASAEYLSGHPNVVTFDFFGLLADPSTNMLRARYTSDPSDAHPNELANETIGPLFVDFVVDSMRAFAGRQ